MLPKSTISPILKTLLEEKIIQMNAFRYKIGVNSFKIGNKFIDGLNIIDTIKAHMQVVVNKCNEICQLGILDNKDVVYIAKVDPVQPIQLSSSVGNTLPANCTALGKILLSSLNHDEIKTLYKNGLDKITQKSVVNMDLFLKQISCIKEQGFALERGESNPQIECIAVPIYAKDKLIAAMSVSIPIFRSSKNLIKKIKSQLLYQSSQISQEISILDVNTI